MTDKEAFTRYTIRIPTELYDRLQAASGHKSLNAEITDRLEASFEGDMTTIEGLKTHILLVESRLDYLEALTKDLLDTLFSEVADGVKKRANDSLENSQTGTEPTSEEIAKESHYYRED